jgi:hypothetical protein
LRYDFSTAHLEHVIFRILTIVFHLYLCWHCAAAGKGGERVVACSGAVPSAYIAADAALTLFADTAASAAGKGGERGVARPEVLQSLLGSCERVVQEIDSVEYGLTDIQVGSGGGGCVNVQGVVFVVYYDVCQVWPD